MQIKSQIKQEDYSGIRQHSLIFTGTAKTFSPPHQSEI
jgi:hypothetical protein